MTEKEYWRYEYDPTRRGTFALVFNLVFAVLFAVMIFFVYWAAAKVSLVQAWQVMGGTAVGLGIYLYAAFVAGQFYWEWLYRRTKALPASVRGFDIERRPQDLEDLALVPPFAMDGPQQRDWESTRSAGMVRFVARWFLIIFGNGLAIFLLFWLASGPGRLDDAWHAMGRIVITSVFLGIAAGLCLWFCYEWSYRKGKARAVDHK